MVIPVPRLEIKIGDGRRAAAGAFHPHHINPLGLEADRRKTGKHSSFQKR
jgi:hypothetical protein